MKNIIIWSLILLFTITIIYSIKDILGPFVFALVMAYSLQPMVTQLEKIKIPRSLSTTVIICCAFSVIASFFLLIFPLGYSQFITIMHAAPDYLAVIKGKINPFLSEFGYTFDQQTIVNKYSTNILRFVTNFVDNVWSSTIMLFNIISLLFITPIITFYTLRDWPLIIRSIGKLVPTQYYSIVSEQMMKIDSVLSAYIRGQIQVCLILAIFYSVALYSVGLPYSLFIGLATGILSFIPYIGFGTGFAIANIISFYQFDTWTARVLVLLIFIVGQVLEGGIFTPRLIGNNVRLHPVWIIFAIFTGAGLFGFIGVLMAIPIAAVIGVLIRFLLECYFSSVLYGTTTPDQK